MDDILAFAVAVFAWRVIATVAVAVVLVIGSMKVFPWFGGLQALGLVVASLFLGILWNESLRPVADGNVAPATPTPTPKYVSMLAFLFGGLVWGALSSTSVSTAVFGAILLLCYLAGYYWVQSRPRKRSSSKRAIYPLVSAYLGFVMSVLGVFNQNGF